MTKPETFGPGGDAPHDKPLEYEHAREEGPPPAQDAPRWAYAIGSAVRGAFRLGFLVGLVAALSGLVWVGAYLWGRRLPWLPLGYTTALCLALYSTAQHFTARARRYAAVTVAEALAAKLRKKNT